MGCTFVPTIISGEEKKQQNKKQRHMHSSKLKVWGSEPGLWHAIHLLNPLLTEPSAEEAPLTQLAATPKKDLDTKKAHKDSPKIIALSDAFILTHLIHTHTHILNSKV